MTDLDNFSPDLDALLAPISADQASGPSMRYHALYASIRQAREEENAALPMGVWERALKKANWAEVEALCVDLLTNHSKDLQVATWLTEAWLHLYQVRGFIAGTTLLNGLVEGFWDDVHPQIEDGDDDARAAPFVWMNENLSRTLLLKLLLLKVPECVPSLVTLAQWEQTLVQERQQTDDDATTAPLGEKPLTRDRILAAAQGANLKALIGLHELLKQAVSQWQDLTTSLDSKMTVNPPSIARVGEMLRRIERLAASLIDGRTIQTSSPESTNAAAEPDAVSPQAADLQDEAALPSHFAQRATPMNPADISSREEAYQQLTMIASFLQELEPHSPTPYLIRRAVKWGRMSLTELMPEILREEGDVARFFSLLGVDE